MYTIGFVPAAAHRKKFQVHLQIAVAQTLPSHVRSPASVPFPQRVCLVYLFKSDRSFDARTPV